MKRGLLTLAAVFLLQAQPPETPTFRTSTTLVEFAIVAQDEKGNPVTDLRREEVSIRDNNTQRDVAVFRFYGGETGVAPPAQVPRGVFSNAPEYSGTGAPQPNVIVIALDPINTPIADQMSARNQTLRYLRQLPPGSRMAVYRLGKPVTVVHDFTDSVESVRQRIASLGVSVAGQQPDPGFGFAPPAGSESAAAANEAADAAARAIGMQNAAAVIRNLFLTLEALEAVGNHVAAIPGRKSLVWVSNSIPVLIPLGHGVTFNAEPYIRRSAQRLASRGVALYPSFAKGLQTGVPSASESRGPSRVLPGKSITAAWSRNWATMDILADVTGGRVSKFTNDPTMGVTLAGADERGAYALGFYVGEPDNQWHSLKVKVSRPGVKLLHQQGYLSEAPTEKPVTWSADEWRTAGSRPLGSTAIRLEARPELVAGALQLTLSVPAKHLHFRDSMANVEIGIVERNAAGPVGIRRIDGTIRLPEGGAEFVRYRGQWDVSPETTMIRVILRDRRTGRYGTLDVPVSQIPVASGAVQ